MTTNSPSAALICSPWFTPTNSLSYCTSPSDPFLLDWLFYWDQTCRLEILPRQRSMWGFLLLTNGVIRSAGHSICYHLTCSLGLAEEEMTSFSSIIQDWLTCSQDVLIQVSVNVPSAEQNVTRKLSPTLKRVVLTTKKTQQNVKLHAEDFCSYWAYQAFFLLLFIVLHDARLVLIVGKNLSW